MSATIITMANNKGGTLKTTTTFALGQYFAFEGKKTLMIDFDPQCNLSYRVLDMDISTAADGTSHFSIQEHPDYDPNDPENEDWDGKGSTYTLFAREVCIQYPTGIENLDIVPAESLLQKIEETSDPKVLGKIYELFESFLQESGYMEEYDIILIDTRPSQGPLTRAALRASTHMIIPSEMEDMSIEGLLGMVGLWTSINLTRDVPLKLVGLLATKYDQRLSMHKNNFQFLKDHPVFGPLVLKQVIHSWTTYKDMTRKVEPLLYKDRPDNDRLRMEVKALGILVEENIYGG